MRSTRYLKDARLKRSIRIFGRTGLLTCSIALGLSAWQLYHGNPWGFLWGALNLSCLCALMYHRAF